ncbi:MAG: enoyl-CoA hydratase/isomerase family protein [Gammaproteobacteria bacterium]|nr:enoyl-CoA hydratase/isomerase family protein [Gammaproteobacteria bacterium]MBQ0838949.1 enoyl-CoA hydratase/isomerase family protein [Gammaproteobacteria bacterium]
MSPVIEISQQDGVGIIKLNRPEQFNCLSMALHESLYEAMDQFEVDSSVRAVLIAANGKNFCTGADLEEVSGFRDSDEDIRAFLETGLDTLRKLETSPLPVVIAQQGLALAGGLELVLAGDVVFAGKSAQLGDQHAHFGLIPGWGGSQRLPRLIGRRRALELMLSARWLNAQEALDFGLVNYVIEDEKLFDSALAYCQQLSQRSSAGLALMKQLTDRGLDMPLEQGLALELDLATPALRSEAVSEGLRAFGEKRAPKFS